MTDLLVEIITLLTGGLTQMATAIGSALQQFVTSMFLVTTGTGADAVTSLSVFGGIIIIFGAISLAVSLGRLVYGFLTSWGN